MSRAPKVHLTYRFNVLAVLGFAALAAPGSAPGQCPEEPVFTSPSFGTLGTGDAWGQAGGYLCPSYDDNREAIPPCGCEGPDYCPIPSQFCNDYWVEVDDPVTPQSPDFYQIGCEFPVGMEGDAINIRIHDFTVRAGYEMTFGGLDRTETILVRTLALPSFLIAADFEEKTVFGYSGSGDCLWVETECAGGFQPAAIDPTGSWAVDLWNIGSCNEDFGPGQWVAIHLLDEDGDNFNRHWHSTLVPSLRCEGFDVPLESYPLRVRGKRALPLRATLLDVEGQEVTDLDVVSPPVVQIWFRPAIGDAQDVTGEVLPVGHADEGNQFAYGGAGHWRFNLSTRGFSSPGTYEVTMASGNNEEYLLDPYDTCMTQFTVE